MAGAVIPADELEAILETCVRARRSFGSRASFERAASLSRARAVRRRALDEFEEEEELGNATQTEEDAIAAGPDLNSGDKGACAAGARSKPTSSRPLGAPTRTRRSSGPRCDEDDENETGVASGSWYV